MFLCFVQPPQMFQYTMSTVNQGKYPRAKGTSTKTKCCHGPNRGRDPLGVWWVHVVTKPSLSLPPLSPGSVGPGQRADHGGNGPPMLQAAASAAGAPLVASPYPQQYLQYNPQQYGQQQVLQAMAPYPGQVRPLRPLPDLHTTGRQNGS